MVNNSTNTCINQMCTKITTSHLKSLNITQMKIQVRVGGMYINVVGLFILHMLHSVSGTYSIIWIVQYYNETAEMNLN